MRIRLQRLLLKVAEKEITSALPQFRVFRETPKQFYGPGILFFDATTVPTAFMYLQISEKRDAFTIELAWSKSGKFPDNLQHQYPVPRDWPEIGVRRGDVGQELFRFRLCNFWVYPKYDPWWEFVPRESNTKSAELSVVASSQFSDEQKCVELLHDVIARMHEFGLGYLFEIRQRFA